MTKKFSALNQSLDSKLPQVFNIETAKLMSGQSKRTPDIGSAPNSAFNSAQSSRKDVKDFRFVDFMPRDERSGQPIKVQKPGSLHFHMNLGSCYDSMITEEMNSFVPKHKSYLKESDLRYVC